MTPGTGETVHFDVPTACAFARAGRLEEWIHAYLRAGHWANVPLSEGLARQRRWWNGPLELPLDCLTPCVGPSPDMEYVVEPEGWAEHTADMAAGFTELLAVPPLIAEYRAGALSIRDGNTRYAAFRIKGWRTCWAIIWYNAEEDFRAHTACLAGCGLLAVE